MGKLSTAYNLIKWGAQSAAAITICTWIAASQGDLYAAPTTPTNNFNQHNTQADTAKLCVTNCYGKLTFNAPDIRKTALSLTEMKPVKGEMPPEMQLAVLYATQDGPVPMDFFIRMAKIENAQYDTDIVNGNTCARGLFQITPPTQLQLLCQKGNAFPAPYNKIAAQVERYTIKRDNKNRAVFGFRVKKGHNKKAVIESCNDPVMNTLLAREYVIYNAKRLARKLPGHTLTFTDLYLAHFFDAPKAARFIKLAGNKQTSSRPADSYFKSAAGQNKGMFYKRNGTPRSLAEMYDHVKRVMGSTPIHLNKAPKPHKPKPHKRVQKLRNA